MFETRQATGQEPQKTRDSTVLTLFKGPKSFILFYHCSLDLMIPFSSLCGIVVLSVFFWFYFDFFLSSFYYCLEVENVVHTDWIGMSYIDICIFILYYSVVHIINLKSIQTSQIFILHLITNLFFYLFQNLTQISISNNLYY
jgi:hypothetical protein